MPRMKGGACYNLLDIAIRVKRWLYTIESKRPPIYTDTCIVRSNITDDGLCFYNALLTALGKNSGGKTQNEIDNSQQLARYIAEWLEINKDTIIPVAGGMRLEDAMPKNDIPQHLRIKNSKAKKFSFKEYIKETINFQGITPNVYPELEVSGWAAANVLNVNIKVFIANQNTTYTPLATEPGVPTISLFNTGNHFELCRPQGGGNYLRKYKMARTRKQKGGACYKLLETGSESGSMPNLNRASGSGSDWEANAQRQIEEEEKARRAALSPEQKKIEKNIEEVRRILAQSTKPSARAANPAARAANPMVNWRAGLKNTAKARQAGQEIEELRKIAKGDPTKNEVIDAKEKLKGINPMLAKNIGPPTAATPPPAPQAAPAAPSFFSGFFGLGTPKKNSLIGIAPGIRKLVAPPAPAPAPPAPARAPPAPPTGLFGRAGTPGRKALPRSRAPVTNPLNPTVAANPLYRENPELPGTPGNTRKQRGGKRNKKTRRRIKNLRNK